MKINLDVYPGLSYLSDRYDCILLDASGVFWGGNDFGVLPGSREAMAQCIQKGKVIGILSNSTQLASREIEKFQRQGLIQKEHFHFLVTSGEIARKIFLKKDLPFATPRMSFWLFGGPHPKFPSHEALFKETGYREASDIDQADFIYLSIPHIGGIDQANPEVFRSEIAKIKVKNLPMICPNPDLFAHEGNPPKAVARQGSIAKIYEEMGGQVFYIGKPNSRVYKEAFDQFLTFKIVKPAEILMVGDTPETDIRGAHLFGMRSALTTQTGIMADRISQKGSHTALRELSLEDFPDYLIERL